MLLLPDYLRVGFLRFFFIGEADLDILSPFSETSLCPRIKVMLPLLPNFVRLLDSPTLGL